MVRRSDNILVWLTSLSAVLLVASNAFRVSGKMQIGVNLGLMGDDLPSISTTVDLLSTLHAGAVRLYDANPEMLSALSNTPHEVIVSLRNDQLADIATSPEAADAWVQASIVPFYPATKITFIAVGNEVLRDNNIETVGQYLLPALRNVYGALEARNLHDGIKCVSPLSGEILGTAWPPAAGFFDRLQYVLPLLHFLEDTGSTFFINLYPYYAHIADEQGVSFEFATFQETGAATFVDPISSFEYSNLFESMLDAAYNAMASVGFPDLPLVVGETGWPTGGGSAATIQNAELFNRNLVQHVWGNGTPERPNVRTPVFIFALFNENQKPGPAPERFWGLLNADGSPVYPIDLADPTLAPDASTLIPVQAVEAVAPADNSFPVYPSDNFANPGDDVVNNPPALPVPEVASTDIFTPAEPDHPIGVDVSELPLPTVAAPAADTTPANPLDAFSASFTDMGNVVLTAPTWQSPEIGPRTAEDLAADDLAAQDIVDEYVKMMQEYVKALPLPPGRPAAAPRVRA